MERELLANASDREGRRAEVPAMSTGPGGPGDVPAVDEGSPPRPASTAAVWRGVLAVLAIYAASRAAIWMVLALGTRIVPTVSFDTIVRSWDAGWYLKAAANGYPREIAVEGGRAVQSTIAFFPVFPLSVRAVHAVTGLSYESAAIVSSVTWGAAACVLLWLLVRHIADDRTATRAVALLAFFPSSFALLLPFSEGALLTFGTLCMLALLRRRWAVAGAAAALAAAARPNGLVLAACCLWEAGKAIRLRREWRALVAPALAPLGIVAYFAFLAHHTGSWTVWVRVQREGWGYDKSDFGLTTLKRLDIFFDQPLLDLNALGSSVALVFAVVALALLVRWRPPAILVIYAVGTFVLAFAAGGLPASRPRYVLAMFPLIAAVAWWARTLPRFAGVLGTSAMLLAAYAILCTTTSLAVF